MAELIPVPGVAAGTTEVVVLEWLVAPGTSFALGDPLVVIETEKAIVEVEADRTAVLLRQLVAGGTLVDVGAPLALIGEASELNADHEQILAKLGALAAAVGDSNVVAEPLDCPMPGSDPVVSMGQRSAGGTSIPPAPASGGNLRADGQRKFVSPIARRLLREANALAVDIAGSGPDGRVLRRDVEAYLRGRLAPSSQSSGSSGIELARASAASEGAWTDVPHSRLRRAVAVRLTASKNQVPHFYLRRTASIDALMKLRGEVNSSSGIRISVNDLIIRAVAVAHRHVPEANAIWTDDAIRRFDNADIGVAIASPRGLVTPVLRSVESQSLGSIAKQIKAFVGQAAEGRLRQSDLEGGSITVTNLGMFGVEEFDAIINPPQSAILAVGAARKQAVVRMSETEDAVAIENVMRLVLSVDHRAIDGALAATWMGSLVSALEDPISLLV